MPDITKLTEAIAKEAAINWEAVWVEENIPAMLELLGGGLLGPGGALVGDATRAATKSALAGKSIAEQFKFALASMNVLINAGVQVQASLEEIHKSKSKKVFDLNPQPEPPLERKKSHK